LADIEPFYPAADHPLLRHKGSARRLYETLWKNEVERRRTGRPLFDPSYREIARRLGFSKREPMSHRQVVRIVHYLESNAFVRTERVKGRGNLARVFPLPMPPIKHDICHDLEGRKDMTRMSCLSAEKHDTHVMLSERDTMIARDVDVNKTGLAIESSLSRYPNLNSAAGTYAPTAAESLENEETVSGEGDVNELGAGLGGPPALPGDGSPRTLALLTRTKELSPSLQSKVTISPYPSAPPKLEGDPDGTLLVTWVVESSARPGRNGDVSRLWLSQARKLIDQHGRERVIDVVQNICCRGDVLSRGAAITSHLENETDGRKLESAKERPDYSAGIRRG
jgi:hypothetical protein